MNKTNDFSSYYLNVKTRFAFGVILILMAICPMYGQEVQVRGTVTDSIAPLGFANVIATNSESGNLAGYSITNNDGRYALSLNAGQTYVLRASFLVV